MRYRRLSLEELDALKSEFIRFLIVHGIDAPAWETLKEEKPDQAQAWIELFSTFIFDGIIEKVAYLEHFDGSTLWLFKCEENEIALLALQSENTFDSLKEFHQAVADCPDNFLIKRQQKPYHPDRGIEIFNMMERGAAISDGVWFQALADRQVT